MNCNKLTIMDSLENDRSVLRQTGDKLLQQLSHDSISMDITGTTTSKASFEMSSKSTIWVSPSPSAAKPNSTFPSPLTASGSLPTPWSSGLSYPCNKMVAASDQSLVESDSRVDDVTFRPNHPHQFVSAGSGYLLSCNTRSTGQIVSTNDCSENIIATSNTTYDEVDVRRNSWIDPIALAASRQLDEYSRSKDLNYHAQPGCAQPGSSLTSFAGIDEVSSSTISLPSSTSTSISVAIDALPIFMTPVESVKPCPQYCRCHGYSPVSLQNNHGNTMLYPTPDLLQNTEPDQFSSSSTSTSWTMCMNSPLVCPGPFQPPLKSFKSVMPGYVAEEGANLVSSVTPPPIASKMNSAPSPTPSPSGEDRAYPVEMVPSAWLTSLVNEAVGKGIDHEVTTPTTAPMILNSASKMDSTLKASLHRSTSFPPTTSPNCDKYDESASRAVADFASIAVATNTFSIPDDRQSLYPRIYPACPPPAYPAYPLPEYPSYPPPEYTGHFPFGYHTHPTPGYHAHPPCGYYPGPGSILVSRPTSHSLPYGDHGDATEEIPHIYRRCFPSRDDDRPRSADGDKQKVPIRKRGPNTSTTRRLLVDQFPDLLPVIFWCLNHEQTNTSASRSSTTPMMTVPFIRKIITECIPGIKERGGIGITTLRKFVSRVKKAMRNKVDFDQAKAVTTPTAMVASSLSQPLMQEISAEGVMDAVSHSVSKGNTAELPDRLADSIQGSIMKDSDFEFLKAPAEPILQSMIQFVNNTSNERSTASSRKNRAEKTQDSQHRSLDNDAQHRTLDNDAQEKFDAETSFVYDISTGGSMFQSLMDAHDIAEDEVKRLSKTSKTFCESSSADGSDANEPPVKSSDFQPEIAAAKDKWNDPVKSSDFQPEIAAAKDKWNDVANDPSSEPAMCNDYDSDDDIMVIDESFQNI